MKGLQGGGRLPAVLALRLTRRIDDNALIASKSRILLRGFFVQGAVWPSDFVSLLVGIVARASGVAPQDQHFRHRDILRQNGNFCQVVLIAARNDAVMWDRMRHISGSVGGPLHGANTCFPRSGHALTVVSLRAESLGVLRDEAP